jgi:hypothetical protein
MKPGDSIPLRDVLDPKPRPMVTAIPAVEQPVLLVMKDDLGLFGEANVIASAINTAAGRNRGRLPLWVQITAYVMAALALAPVFLSFF